MNWKIGQKLVCIKKSAWVLVSSKKPVGFGPEYMDQVVFDGQNISGYIFLLEYKQTNSLGIRVAFDPQFFRPLLGESAMSELTKIEPVKETSDCPIHSPQTATT